jgi:hypothetical protein
VIKILCFLSRRDDISREQFHDHWRTEHARIFAEVDEIRRHIVRYEQNHRLEQDYARDRGPGESSDGGRDGVAVQWFESLEAFRRLQSEPAFRELVGPDEEKFMKRDDLSWIVAGEEDVIFDDAAARAAAPVKLLCIFRRNPALDREHFHRHWRDHHGGLFRDVPELRRDVVRYVQNHRLTEDYARDPAGFDGVTEQWFEGLDRFVSSLSEPKVRELVGPDVAYMLDASSIEFILSGPPEVILG